MLSIITFDPNQLEGLHKKVESIRELDTNLFIVNRCFYTLSANTHWLEFQTRQQGKLTQKQTAWKGNMLIVINQGLDAITIVREKQATICLTKDALAALSPNDSCVLQLEVHSHAILIWLPTDLEETISIKLPLPVTHVLKEYNSLSIKQNDESSEWIRLAFIYQVVSQIKALIEDYRNHDPVSAIKTYLTRHLDQPFPSLTFLASLANMSVSTLKAKFYKEVGVSSQQFFLQKKLEIGKQLLERGISPTQAAYQLGYKKAASFSRSFKQRFGLSPSDYQALFKSTLSQKDQ